MKQSRHLSSALCCVCIVHPSLHLSPRGVVAPPRTSNSWLASYTMSMIAIQTANATMLDARWPRHTTGTRFQKRTACSLGPENGTIVYQFPSRQHSQYVACVLYVPLLRSAPPLCTLHPIRICASPQRKAPAAHPLTSQLSHPFSRAWGDGRCRWLTRDCVAWGSGRQGLDLAGKGWLSTALEGSRRPCCSPNRWPAERPLIA